MNTYPPSLLRASARVLLFALASALVLLLFAVARPALAQTTVQGRVAAADGGPVPFANVQLLVYADSSLAQGTIADEAGRYLLRQVTPGDYLLHVSLLGYDAQLSGPFAVGGEAQRDFGTATLVQTAIELQELSVEARRSLYEQQRDRLVVHVGTSVILSGASVLDVLGQAPGVLVDRQSGTVSMLGKDGVQLLVNGKPSYVPADALLEYLAGLSADNVERLELVTSPGAEFDAEGNAGFVNLVLKRSPEDGLSGSMAASGGYGAGEIGSASANVSYRRGRVGVFGSYSFLWDAREQFGTNFRRVLSDQGVIETPTETYRDGLQRNHNLRAGIEVELGARTKVGALLAAYENRWSMDAVNGLTVKMNGTPTTRVDIQNEEMNRWRHVMGNVNVQRQLGAGSTLSADLDYLYYHNENPTDYFNTTTEVASGRVSNEEMASGKVTPLGILVGKVDYLADVGTRWSLGAGAKGAFSRFTNEATLVSEVQRAWMADAGLGYTSRLREDVLALYGSADYRMSASSLRLGLRYELTDSNLGTEEEEDIVDRRFGSLFPSILFSHRLGEERRIDASYTRRITRPSFSQIAPFLYFVDPYTVFTGNATLQPAVMSAVKMDFALGSALASAEYAWEDASITFGQSHLLEKENVQVIYSTNQRLTRSATGLVAVPVRLAPWWTTQNNATGVWMQVDGFRNGAPVVMSRSHVLLKSTHNVSLPRDFAFELSGAYVGANLAGTRLVEPSWFVEAGLQRMLPGGRGRLTLTVSDLFNSQKMFWKTGSPGDSFYTEMLVDFSRRTFMLTYSTRFGDGKTMAKRVTASEEESGRVQ